MANLTEIAQWENGIYRIETTDPVLGGENGISNAAAKQLANRTSYLKQLVDAINGNYATQAYVAAQLAALVDSSPAALDTLNELAAALGDDPNFAATMTAALAGKQPLDATLTALAALATSADKLIYATGADSFSLATLSPFARSLLDDPDAATARATLGAAAAVAIASAAEAQAMTDNTKLITPLRLADAFAGANQSLSSNGYQKLPGGLILQWGSNASLAANTTPTVTLPISFPNACLVAMCSGAGLNNVATLATVKIISWNATTITIQNAEDAPVLASWFAIGH